MGTGTLLNCIRLVIHAHFEPYRDPIDNMFEYLMLIISTLTGFGGVLLLGLDTFKEFALSKNDHVSVQNTVDAIYSVQLFLDIGVYTVITVFTLFFANIMVGHNEKVRRVCMKMHPFVAEAIILIRCCCCCGRRQQATEDEGGRGEHDGEDGEEDTAPRLGWLQRSSFRWRQWRGGNAGGGEEKGAPIAAAAGESSTEMVMMRNPSFRRASGERGGEGDDNEEGTAAAARGAIRPSPWMRRPRRNSSHNINPLTVTAAAAECEAAGGEGQGGDDEAGDGNDAQGRVGIYNGDWGRAAKSKARSDAFFKSRREAKVKADAKAARAKAKTRAQMPTAARREAEEPVQGVRWVGVLFARAAEGGLQGMCGTSRHERVKRP